MARLRTRLFALHAWLGLNVGLWLFVVCLSGALAVFAGEIEWLTEPALRIEPRGSVRWQETYEALRHEYPNYQVHTMTRGEGTVLDSQAWIAYMTAPDGRYGVTRIDPYAARVVRPFTTIYLRQFLDQLHYYLYWPPAFIGVYLVTSLAVPLLFSLVTGLLLQRRWWKHLFQLRIGSARRLSWSSAHKFVGLWTLVFGVLIGVTGVWYLVEEAVVPVEIAYPDAPPVPPDRLAAHGPAPATLSLQTYISAAERVFPELEPTQVDLPASADGSVSVKGPAAGRLLVRDRANAVFLDPFDASVVSIRRSNEATWLTWWVDAADPLHFGFWGGLATKVLWCVLGLCLPFLVLSGAYLSLRRADPVGLVAPGGERRSRRLSLQWGVAVVLVGGAAWSCVETYQWMTPPGRAMVDIGARPVGPWMATLSREEPRPANGAIAYHLRLDAGIGRQANFKRAALTVGDKPRGNERVAFSGQSHALLAVAPITIDGTSATDVTLSIEEWSGVEYVVQIPDATHRAGRIPAPLPGHASPPQPDAQLPPASFVFFGVIAGFVAVTVAVIGGWLWIVARPTSPPARRNPAPLSSSS